MNIYLIGYRCSGKSTIGRAVASKKNLPFFDTDEQIINRYNMNIDRIVKNYGWQYFRSKEKEILFKLSYTNRCVIATGGGSVLDYDNLYLMKKSGILVWLKANKKIIKKRILLDHKNINNRPSISGMDIIKDVEYNFCSRKKIYSTIADFTVKTDRFNVDRICDQILSYI